MTQYELESLWVTEGVPGANYRFSDLVRIKSEEYSGQIAEVIALLTLEPETTYMVEFPSGRSAVVRQSDLESTGETAGRTLMLNRMSAD